MRYAERDDSQIQKGCYLLNDFIYMTILQSKNEKAGQWLSGLEAKELKT